MTPKIRHQRIHLGGPFADAPWTAIVGTLGNGPDARRAEAGVQLMGQGDYGLWGWNPSTRESYFERLFSNRAEALVAADTLVREHLAGS
jgi:hypothetical protein